MADLQEIIKTHTKSYPSYLDTYPRNGKTTVNDTLVKFKEIVNDTGVLINCQPTGIFKKTIK